MGSVGNYKYPEHTIEEAYTIVKTIAEYNISKQDLLAEKLGHKSADSGAFGNKLTSLRRYGLINGRGDIELTELSRKAINPAPNSNEKDEALAKAVRNVTLLDLLYNRLDNQRPGDDFWYQVAEIAEVERSEAKEKSSKIKSLYSSGLSYVKRATKKEPQKEQEKKDNKSSSDESRDKEESGLYIRVGNEKLVLEDANEINIEIAKNFLESKKKN